MLEFEIDSDAALMAAALKFQLLPPASPYYPFPRGKLHTRVI